MFNDVCCVSGRDNSGSNIKKRQRLKMTILQYYFRQLASPVCVRVIVFGARGYCYLIQNVELPVCEERSALRPCRVRLKKYTASYSGFEGMKRRWSERGVHGDVYQENVRFRNIYSYYNPSVRRNHIQ